MKKRILSSLAILGIAVSMAFAPVSALGADRELELFEPSDSTAGGGAEFYQGADTQGSGGGDSALLISEADGSASEGEDAASGDFTDDSAAEPVDPASLPEGTYVSNNGTVFTMPQNVDSSLRVYDYADLFSDNEESSLRDQIAKTEKSRKCDVVVLTSYDVPTDAYYGMETSRNYAEQFYLDNGFQDDGWIFIIDMNNRVLWSAGHGRFYQEKYVDFAEDVYNRALTYAGNGDFYGAASSFVKEVYKLDNILYAAIPTPLSLIISAILGALTWGSLAARHRKTQPTGNSDLEVKTLRYRQTRHSAVFAGRQARRERIVRSTGGSSGGSGGGFSGGMHSGGGFSGGGGGGGGGGFSGGGGHF